MPATFIWPSVYLSYLKRERERERKLDASLISFPCFMVMYL